MMCFSISQSHCFAYIEILDDFITHCDLKNHLNSSYCPNYAPASDSNRGGNPKLTKGGEASVIVGPLSICIVLVLIIAW